MLIELCFFSAFIFSENLSAYFCWQKHIDKLLSLHQYGKKFVAHITLSHAFKKINKNVTKQLRSNTVWAQIFLTLWTLIPGAASSCLCAYICKHNNLQFIY